MNIMHCKTVEIFTPLIVALVIIFGSLARAEANNCTVPGDLVAARPDPKGVPTEIAVGFYVIDLIKIDDAGQLFEADVYVTVSWNDPRLSVEALGKSLETCRISYAEIWHPQANIINRQKLEKSYGDIVQIDKDGNVKYSQRLLGEFSSPFNLRDFPFDDQMLKISVTSFGYDNSEVVFILDELRTGRFAQFSVPGWSVKLVPPKITTEYIAPRDRNIFRLDFRLSASRNSEYYLLKVLFPMTLIVFMAWTVFWINPEDVGPQIGISTASVLTLIAFQFSFGYLLPPVSYLTRSDKFLFSSTILIFLALSEAVVTARLAKSGKGALAQTIDRWSRFIYAILFAVFAVYSLWL